MKELKKNYTKMKETWNINNEIEKKWDLLDDNDPKFVEKSQEIEKEFDRTYKEYWEYREKTIENLYKILDYKYSIPSVRAMLNNEDFIKVLESNLKNID